MRKGFNLINPELNHELMPTKFDENTKGFRIIVQQETDTINQKAITAIDDLEKMNAFIKSAVVLDESEALEVFVSVMLNKYNVAMEKLTDAKIFSFENFKFLTDKQKAVIDDKLGSLDEAMIPEQKYLLLPKTMVVSRKIIYDKLEFIARINEPKDLKKTIEDKIRKGEANEEERELLDQAVKELDLLISEFPEYY